MSGELFIAFKALLGFGLPLAWAARELVVLRRDRRAAAATRSERVASDRSGAPAAEPLRRAA
jgi:hypothetical protein